MSYLLTQNTKLTSVDFAMNGLSDLTGNALLTALDDDDNKGMKSIGLDMNAVSPAVEQKITVKLWDMKNTRKGLKKSSGDGGDVGMPPLANLAISAALIFGAYKFLAGPPPQAA